MGIPQDPSVLEAWKENLQGRGVDSRCQTGSNGQTDKDDFWSKSPEKSEKTIKSNNMTSFESNPLYHMIDGMTD